MGMMDLKFEAQGLRDEELEREDVVGCRFKHRREFIDREWMILRLCGQKNTRQPVPSTHSISDNSRGKKLGRRKKLHDILGMIIHAGIPQIKSLQVTDGRRFHHFGKLEPLTNLGDT